jgi:hypothetical protein
VVGLGVLNRLYGTAALDFFYDFGCSLLGVVDFVPHMGITIFMLKQGKNCKTF